MRLRAAILLSLAIAGPVAAEGPARPVLTGTQATLAAAPHDLVVFKRTIAIGEFVYRTVLKLPEGATATPQAAREVASQLARFLRDAGYDLAKVRAQVKGDQIEVDIDEGALDKVIVSGMGWLGALKFRAALDLPRDVFNRRSFEVQMQRLALRAGLRGYRYELWPVHLVDEDNAAALLGIEELRAMPLVRPARGYELRIFAETDPWSTGFSPEIIVNGSVGFGAGGRYRWKDIAQDGDRWQFHFRAGAAQRGSLDPDGASRIVNTTDYLTGRWLSRSWGGSSRGLRMTIAPRLELWASQRRDLMLESYRLGTAELGSGAGAQLSPEFGLFFTAGLQRRWLFDVEPAAGTTPGPDVVNVPSVSNRAFLRMTTQYTFNPEELRQDLKNFVFFELNAYRPVKGDRGFLRFELQGRRLLHFGWNELRVGARVSAITGDVSFLDEIPLDDHLRIGFGLAKHTQRVSSLSLEFRYSLLRDKVKAGVFSDVGVWRHLPRDDAREYADLAGSSGAGLCFFLLDELQLDAFYGVGWATDGYTRTGLAIAIKEAF